MTAPATYQEALVALQAALPEIKKSRTAKVKSEKSEYTYKYANLAGISKSLLPMLAGVGLSWTAKPTLNADGKFVLAYKLKHNSGEFEDGEWPLPSSGTPQQIGSAITYARRYTLCSVTGLAPEDDDDDAARAEAGETQQEKNRGRAQRRNTRPAAEQESNAPARITDGQTKKIVEAFTRLGVNDKGRRLAVAAKVAGRDLKTSTELTAAEATALFDLLVPMVQAGEEGPLLLAEFLDRPPAEVSAA